MKQDKKSFRMRWDFWLDVAKPEQHELAEYLEQMKHERLFAKTIRDGIRLIRDLRAGNVTVLVELFPALAERLQPPQHTAELASLVDQFKAAMQAVPVAPSAGLPIPLPSFDDSQPVTVSVVYDETAARERTIAATLQSLADF